RLHIIGQCLDDLLEQFDGLFSLPLSLNQLRQMKKRAGIFGSEFQRATEQRLSFFQLPVLAVEPAEPDVGDEITRIEFELLFELLNRQLAGAREQMRHAQLRMR